MPFHFSGVRIAANAARHDAREAIFIEFAVGVGVDERQLPVLVADDSFEMAHR